MEERTVKPGDTLEFSVWYNAAKILDPEFRFGDQCTEPMANICLSAGLKLGAVTYEVLQPGDERVPAVPRWLESVPGVLPRLLVATGVAEFPSSLESAGLVNDLDPKDLERLRAITRRKHQEFFPGAPVFKDHECDTMINAMGEQVVLETLRQFRQEKVVVGTLAQVSRRSKTNGQLKS